MSFFLAKMEKEKIRTREFLIQSLATAVSEYIFVLLFFLFVFVCVV